MWRYLTAAFNVRPKVPGIGPVSVNWLVAASFVILGFGHPAFWLLGAGLETTFVTLLASNRRFQKYVDAMRAGIPTGSLAEQRQALVSRLDPPLRARLRALEVKRDRAITLYRDARADEAVVDNSRDALLALEWLYLKLLLARNNLVEHEELSADESVLRQIRDLEKQLDDSHLPASLRESKSATLAILRKRADNQKRRAHTLEEIDSDLTRIEAQFDLAVDNATLQEHPQAFSTNIKLASHLLEDDLWGANQPAIDALDEDFRQKQRATQ